MEVAMFDELSSEDEKKKWLFKENIRLQELSRNLEDERKLIEIQMGMLQRQQSKNMLLKKQLESQRDLFEQKWNILERETRQLAIDKDKFEREKLIYKDKVYREARRSMSNAENVKIFFCLRLNVCCVLSRYKHLTMWLFIHIFYYLKRKLSFHGCLCYNLTTILTECAIL